MGAAPSEPARFSSPGERVYWAATKNRIEELRGLLQHDPRSANTYQHPSMWGRTALLAACYGGHSECVRLLVAAGADTSVRSRNGYSAAEYARFGHGRAPNPGEPKTGDLQGCLRALELGQKGVAEELALKGQHDQERDTLLAKFRAHCAARGISEPFGLAAAPVESLRAYLDRVQEFGSGARKVEVH